MNGKQVHVIHDPVFSPMGQNTSGRQIRSNQLKSKLYWEQQHNSLFIYTESSRVLKSEFGTRLLGILMRSRVPGSRVNALVWI